MAKVKTSLSLSPEARGLLRRIALRFGASERGMSMAAEYCIRETAERDGVQPAPEPKRKRRKEPKP